MNQTILFLSASLGAVGLALAVYFWLTLEKAKGLINQLATKNKKIEITYRKLLKDYNNAQDKFDKDKKRLVTTEKQKADLDKKIGELKIEFEALNAASQEAQRKNTAKVSHLNTQVAALLDQLTGMDKERQQAVTELEAKKEQFVREIANLKKDSSQKTDDGNKKLKKAEMQAATMAKTIEKLEERLKKLDPVKVVKLKKKLGQYSRLYESMKSLKELAEERSKNWETALRKLSLQVLRSREVSKGGEISKSRLTLAEKSDVSIGQLAAIALESIGETILIDEHVVQTKVPNNQQTAAPANSENKEPVSYA